MPKGSPSPTNHARRNRLFRLLKWVGLLPVLAILLPHAAWATEGTITLQLRWRHQFQFAGYYAAIEKRYYAAAGLDVRLNPGGGGIDTVEEVVTGQAQYGVTNSELLLHYLKGKPVVVMAAIFQHSPLVIITRESTGITHPQQLIGRSVKMSRHSRDVELHAMLRNEGIDLEQLNLLDTGNTKQDYFDTRFDALSAYLTNEPFWWEDQGIAYRIIRPVTHGIDFYGDCLFTSRQELTDHPERVRAFHRASLKGWAYAMQHPEEMVDLILARYPGIQKSRKHLLYEARMMRNLILPDLVEPGHINSGRWIHIGRIFQKFDMIPGGNLGLSKFIYDPDRSKTERFIRNHLPEIFSAAALVLLGMATLLVFNRRLQKEVRERKTSEAALRQSREKYRELFENSPISLWVVDFSAAKTYLQSLEFETDTKLRRHLMQSPEAMEAVLRRIKIVDLNQATLDLYEAEDKPALLEGLPVIIPLEHAAGVLIDEAVSMTQGRMINTEINQWTLSGRRIHVAIRFSIPPGYEQNWERVYISVHNLTERADAEKEKMQLEGQLRQAQKMEALGTLAGGIAHDFNNILVAIIGYAELALMDVDHDSQMAHMLTHIRNAGDRASKLVQQILAFSRKSEQMFHPVRLPKVLEEALLLLRSTLPASIEIETRMADDLEEIMGDPTQIHQIIMNICTNAAQALDAQGGRIKINLDQMVISALSTGLPRGLKDGPHLVLTIQDSGPGIAPKIIEHIFDPYFTTKPRGEGTGLGLSVVHGIVKAHNGAITVRSRPNQGTRFTIFLPTMPATKPIAEAEDHALACGSEHLLVVDDEPSIADLFEETLQRLEYTVTTHTDSTEALAAFQRDPQAFDLVITDMTMPKMTGDQLARKVMEIRPGTPVILCTGYSKQISEDKAHAMGIRAFIQKPPEIHKLSHTIRQVLDGEKGHPCEE